MERLKRMALPAVTAVRVQVQTESAQGVRGGGGGADGGPARSGAVRCQPLHLSRAALLPPGSPPRPIPPHVPGRLELESWRIAF